MPNIVHCKGKKTYLPAKINPKTQKKEGGGPCFLGIEVIFDDVHSKLAAFPLVDIDGKKKQPRGHKVWWSPRTGRFSLHNPHKPVYDESSYQRDEGGHPIPGTAEVQFGMKGLPMATASKGNSAKKDGEVSLEEAKFLKTYGMWLKPAIEAIKAEEGYIDIAAIKAAQAEKKLKKAA